MTSAETQYGAPAIPPGTTVPAMPRVLQRIRAEAQAFRANHEQRDKAAKEWRMKEDGARRRAPDVVVEDDGETLRLGPLSPGCASCKAGRMDCIFVTSRCNLDCAFCICPQSMTERPMASVLGRDLSALCARYAELGVAGVAFTGGEPLLDPEALLKWVSILRREIPALYIWAETNGLLLSAELLGGLADAGLDEIRFNVAATGYRDPFATRMLLEACRRLRSVAVEFPTIPEHTDLILDSLQTWADAGVKYVNLHELVYEAGSNSETFAGARVPLTMPDGHRCAVNPGSSKVVERVLERVSGDGLPLAVNDCSLRAKAGQMRGRRRLLAPLVLRSCERLRADGLAECVCIFDGERLQWVNPECFSEGRRPHTGWHAVLLRRQLPLVPGLPGEWVHFELLDGSHVGS